MQAHPQNRPAKNANKKPSYIIAVQKFRSIIQISIISLVAVAVLVSGEAAQTTRRIVAPTFATTATEGSTS